jgi:TPR repeat protein
MQPLLPLLLVVTVAAGPAGFVRRHPKKPEIDLGIEAQARAYEKACAAGEMASCVGLAGMYYFGYGVPADRSEAERLYRLGCDAGQAQGCLDLGTMYHNGDGVPQDPAAAAVLYRRACEKGLEDACSAAADLQAAIRGGRLLERGLLPRTACDAGDALHCHNLGMDYESGNGVREDWPRAAYFYDRACAAGHEESCEWLERLVRRARRGCRKGEARRCLGIGALHEMGLGVPQELLQATLLYQRACALGSADGCRHRARTIQALREACSSDAEERCPDLAVALRGWTALLLERRCASGDPESCSGLVALYREACQVEDPAACLDAARWAAGSRVLPDAGDLSLAWFRKACKGGSPEGCTAVADELTIAGAGRFSSFRGKDPIESRLLYEQACEAGWAEACRGLADIYADGAWVLPDLHMADTLYLRACQGGSPRACALLERRRVEPGGHAVPAAAHDGSGVVRGVLVYGSQGAPAPGVALVLCRMGETAPRTGLLPNQRLALDGDVARLGFAWVGESHQVDVTRSSLAPVSTDPSGQFEFAEVPEGDYAIAPLGNRTARDTCRVGVEGNERLPRRLSVMEGREVDVGRVTIDADFPTADLSGGSGG